MYEILTHTPPIVAITVFFVLSLTGAIVLFHFLKSTGVFSTVKGQAGGALAGFLMIFAAMDASYLALAPGAEEIADLLATQEELETEITTLRELAAIEEWTLRGQVERPAGAAPGAVKVRVLPHSPQDLLLQRSDFRLEDVEIRNGTWPEIYLEGDGYSPKPTLLTEDDLEIHPELKLAILKEPLLLEPDPHTSFEIAGINN